MHGFGRSVAFVLILDRRIRERIRIGEDIEIVVMDVARSSGRVKLGIRGPQGLRILRGEVCAGTAHGGDADPGPPTEP